MLGIAKPRDFPNYDEDYISQMRMQGLAAAARQLTEIGFPADAVPLYNQAMALAETSSEINYIGNREAIVQSARKGLEDALHGLKDEQLVRTVRGLLEPPADAENAGGKAAAAARARASTRTRRSTSSR